MLKRKLYQLCIPAAAKDHRNEAQRSTTSPFDVNVLAELTTSLHYQGEHLGDGEPVAALALEVDIEPLKRYLRQQRERAPLATSCSHAAAAHEAISREDIDAWQGAYIRHLLEVSDLMTEGGHAMEKYHPKSTLRTDFHHTVMSGRIQALSPPQL